MKIILNGISALISISFLFPNLNGQNTIVTTYPDTEQRWEKIYDNERKTAENFYYPDSSLWMTVTYSPDSEENWKSYYANGNPYFEVTIVNNLLQGRYRIWYENGQLAESINFKDNLEDGMAEFFHPNGQLAMKGVFKNGEMVGEWEFYDEAGNPPTGNWEWMFAASRENTRVKGLLIYGKPSGTWINWTTANQGKPNQNKFIKDYQLEMFVN
jgi:hypothetical protein